MPWTLSPAPRLSFGHRLTLTVLFLTTTSETAENVVERGNADPTGGVGERVVLDDGVAATAVDAPEAADDGVVGDGDVFIGRPSCPSGVTDQDPVAAVPLDVVVVDEAVGEALACHGRKPGKRVAGLADGPVLVDVVARDHDMAGVGSFQADVPLVALCRSP